MKTGKHLRCLGLLATAALAAACAPAPAPEAPPAAPAATQAQGATAPAGAQPVMGLLTEEEFKALHQLTPERRRRRAGRRCRSRGTGRT